MIYSRESLDILKNLINFRDILISLGNVSPNSISETSDEIRCPCPLHNGNNKSGFSFKKSTGAWSCYTKQCGDGLKRDVFSFVQLKLGIGFIDAAKKLADLSGYTLEKGTINGNEYYKVKEVIKEQEQLKELPKPKKLNVLNELPGFYPEGEKIVTDYLKARNYHPSITQTFKFYPQLDSFNMLRMAIPVYDQHGYLVGVNARLMDKVMSYPSNIISKDGRSFDIPKYRLSKFEKSNVLFNLNNAKKYSVKNGLIIVEGQLDVARLHSFGYPNAVCLMGTCLSPQQASLLYTHTYKVIFLVEEGKAAEEGVIKSLKFLKNGMKVFIAKLPSGDADSNTKDIIDKTLRTAKQLKPDDFDAIMDGIIEL